MIVKQQLNQFFFNLIFMPEPKIQNFFYTQFFKDHFGKICVHSAKPKMVYMCKLKMEKHSLERKAVNKMSHRQSKEKQKKNSNDQQNRRSPPFTLCSIGLSLKFDDGKCEP